ncbi:MAG: SUMF1/EgtB/PvdO family nonheme iron enzyme [Phormidesmis sp.]
MARKIALLIGVSDYGAGLKSLQCPINGVAAMQSILECPEIGGFDEVVALLNPDVGEMRSRISEVFASLTKRDLVLFYFTGHGLKDMTGDFYLTTTQTELFPNGRPNAGTAVEADFLKRELSNCTAERKVVILDCCFGAAFADGFLAMSDESVDIEAQLGGKGWCILTSSTSSRYALEQQGKSLSVYTRYLVEGLKTGGAAPDGQDFISVQNLHEYVTEQIRVAAPAMEPAIFNAQEGYSIVIASVQLNNEQRYRKQVQQKVRNGAIGPAGLAVLRQWQQRLAIADRQAAAIEAEILQPYRERQKHLALYIQALEAEKTVSYPLNELAIQDLKDLQRLLSLRDEDVCFVEQQIFDQQCVEQGTGSSAKRPAEGLAERPAAGLAEESEEGPVKHQAEQQIEQQIEQPMPSWLRSAGHSQDRSQNHGQSCSQNRSQNAIAQQWVRAIRVTPKSLQPLQFQDIQFKTLRVNAQGKVIKRSRGEATTFIEKLGAGITLKMVRIPSGRFTMGAAAGEKEASDNEYPPKAVSLSEFWIGQYVVTQAQWKAIMGPKVINAQTPPNAIHRIKKPLQPIDNIFWTDAVEFCQRLSQLTGRDYRLPSDAQWEYACRAETTTPFHFGDTLTPDLANYNGNYAYGEGPKGLYREQSTEVGCFPPNGFGLYDMHGNVWEWCLDGWQNFEPHSPARDNIQRLSGQKKSLRGGSWFYLPTNCRSAHRLTYPFHSRTDDIGFRVVCTLPSTL